ncbi:MAG: hypothetical protein JWP35_674 [Caulobacter sp.]|nr:hypothetical protein [Caulobacter sp.]
MTSAALGSENTWPDLALPSLKATCDTLQLWSQVVGKVRLAQTPWLNHSWHVPLYVSAAGLTTGLIPHAKGGFDMEFDFDLALLRIRSSRQRVVGIPLEPQSMAQFYRRTMHALEMIGAPVAIGILPSELPDPVLAFPEDHALRPYDGQAALAYWRALIRVDEVFKLFRTSFLGKCSPVHLFWGALDLAVTRFSGRPAPPHPGGVPHLPDAVAREAYSHEVSSAGFWPGGDLGPTFYAYAYPEPPGFRDAPVSPPGAAFDAGLGEYLLAYDRVRAAPDPQAALMAFLTSTYAAAADNAGWDREALECGFGKPGVPRRI